MEKYMLRAIKEAKKSLSSGDVPVGSVIVENDIIIACGHNRKEKTSLVTRHAEIEAIEKACRRKKSWHLDNCSIYTTVEPCTMCYGAIQQARIKKIYYAIPNEKYGAITKNNKKINWKIEIIEGMCQKESELLMKTFFSEKRK